MIQSSPPLDLRSVREVSQVVRSIFEKCHPEYFSGKKVDAMGLLQRYADETALNRDKLILDIVHDHEMHEAVGETNTQTGCIKLPERTLNGALKKRPEDVFTVLHEMGHHFLHQGVSLKRLSPGATIPLHRDPENQADAFVMEFLIKPEEFWKRLKRDEALGLSRALNIPLSKVVDHSNRLSNNGDTLTRQLEMIF